MCDQQSGLKQVDKTRTNILKAIVESLQKYTNRFAAFLRSENYEIHYERQ